MLVLLMTVNYKLYEFYVERRIQTRGHLKDPSSRKLGLFSLLAVRREIPIQLHSLIGINLEYRT
jgi:hypothetical protein